MCSVDIVGQEVIHIWEVPTQGGGAGAMWSFTHTYPCSISSRGLDRSGQRPVFADQPGGGTFIILLVNFYQLSALSSWSSTWKYTACQCHYGTFWKCLSAKLVHDHNWSCSVDKLLMWTCQPLWMPYLMIILSRFNPILLGCYSKCWAAACCLPTVL